MCRPTLCRIGNKSVACLFGGSSKPSIGYLLFLIHFILMEKEKQYTIIMDIVHGMFLSRCEKEHDVSSPSTRCYFHHPSEACRQLTNPIDGLYWIYNKEKPF